MAVENIKRSDEVDARWNEWEENGAPGLEQLKTKEDREAFADYQLHLVTGKKARDIVNRHDKRMFEELREQTEAISRDNERYLDELLKGATGGSADVVADTVEEEQAEDGGAGFDELGSDFEMSWHEEGKSVDDQAGDAEESSDAEVADESSEKAVEQIKQAVEEMNEGADGIESVVKGNIDAAKLLIDGYNANFGTDFSQIDASEFGFEEMLEDAKREVLDSVSDGNIASVDDAQEQVRRIFRNKTYEKFDQIRADIDKQRDDVMQARREEEAEQAKKAEADKKAAEEERIKSLELSGEDRSSLISKVNERVKNWQKQQMNDLGLTADEVGELNFDVEGAIADAEAWVREQALNNMSESEKYTPDLVAGTVAIKVDNAYADAATAREEELKVLAERKEQEDKQEGLSDEQDKKLDQAVLDELAAAGISLEQMQEAIGKGVVKDLDFGIIIENAEKQIDPSIKPDTKAYWAKVTELSRFAIAKEVERMATEFRESQKSGQELLSDNDREELRRYAETKAQEYGVDAGEVDVDGYIEATKALVAQNNLSGDEAKQFTLNTVMSFIKRDLRELKEKQEAAAEREEQARIPADLKEEMEKVIDDLAEVWGQSALGLKDQLQSIYESVSKRRPNMGDVRYVDHDKETDQAMRVADEYAADDIAGMLRDELRARAQRMFMTGGESQARQTETQVENSRAEQQSQAAESGEGDGNKAERQTLPESGEISFSVENDTIAILVDEASKMGKMEGLQDYVDLVRRYCPQGDGENVLAYTARVSGIANAVMQYVEKMGGLKNDPEWEKRENEVYEVMGKVAKYESLSDEDKAKFEEYAAQWTENGYDDDKIEQLTMVLFGKDHRGNAAKYTEKSLENLMQDIIDGKYQSGEDLAKQYNEANIIGSAKEIIGEGRTLEEARESIKNTLDGIEKQIEITNKNVGPEGSDMLSSLHEMQKKMRAYLDALDRYENLMQGRENVIARAESILRGRSLEDAIEDTRILIRAHDGNRQRKEALNKELDILIEYQRIPEDERVIEPKATGGNAADGGVDAIDNQPAIAQESAQKTERKKGLKARVANWLREKAEKMDPQEREQKVEETYSKAKKKGLFGLVSKMLMTVGLATVLSNASANGEQLTPENVTEAVQKAIDASGVNQSNDGTDFEQAIDSAIDGYSVVEEQVNADTYASGEQDGSSVERVDYMKPLFEENEQHDVAWNGVVSNYDVEGGYNSPDKEKQVNVTASYVQDILNAKTPEEMRNVIVEKQLLFAKCQPEFLAESVCQFPDIYGKIGIQPGADANDVMKQIDNLLSTDERGGEFQRILYRGLEEKLQDPSTSVYVNSVNDVVEGTTRIDKINDDDPNPSNLQLETQSKEYKNDLRYYITDKNGNQLGMRPKCGQRIFAVKPMTVTVPRSSGGGTVTKTIYVKVPQIVRVPGDTTVVNNTYIDQSVTDNSVNINEQTEYNINIDNSVTNVDNSVNIDMNIDQSDNSTNINVDYRVYDVQVNEDNSTTYYITVNEGDSYTVTVNPDGSTKDIQPVTNVNNTTNNVTNNNITNNTNNVVNNTTNNETNINNTTNNETNNTTNNNTNNTTTTTIINNGTPGGGEPGSSEDIKSKDPNNIQSVVDSGLENNGLGGSSMDKENSSSSITNETLTGQPTVDQISSSEQTSEEEAADYFESLVNPSATGSSSELEVSEGVGGGVSSVVSGEESAEFSFDNSSVSADDLTDTVSGSALDAVEGTADSSDVGVDGSGEDVQ